MNLSGINSGKCSLQLIEDDAAVAEKT